MLIFIRTNARPRLNCLNWKLFRKSQCRLNSKVTSTNALNHLEQGENQSFRRLQDGTKLPVSPALDPIVIEKRIRWEKTKSRPTHEELTSFQRRLSNNPYAHILASPIRKCRATHTLFPNDLLTTLHPRPHPENHHPWLLPVSLTTSTHHLGPPYRFLAHKYIAAHLTTKKAWEKSLYTRLEQKLGEKQVSKMVWREDMANLCLELMQYRLRDKLRWWYGKEGRLIPCKSPHSSHTESIDDVSCILYHRSLRSPADEIQRRATAIVHEVDMWAVYISKVVPADLDPHKKAKATHAPPAWYKRNLVARLQPRIRFSPLLYPTTVWRGVRIPVYSLEDILGVIKMEELVQGSRYEDADCLVLRRGRHNVPVELLLLQLQSYMAEPGPG